MSKRWDILGDHSSKDKKITSVSSESAIHFLPKCVSDYLRRTNFPIFSLFRIFFVFAFFAHFVCAKILEIFARIYFRAPSDFQILKPWDIAIETKNMFDVHLGFRPKTILFVDYNLKMPTSGRVKVGIQNSRPWKGEYLESSPPWEVIQQNVKKYVISNHLFLQSDFAKTAQRWDVFLNNGWISDFLICAGRIPKWFSTTRTVIMLL